MKLHEFKNTPKILMEHAYSIRAEFHGQQCPRASVGVLLLDEHLHLLATGKNLLPVKFGACDCNDGVDTLVQGSTTCKAVHAEIMAMNTLDCELRLHQAKVLVTTRPPCKACLEKIMKTGIYAIITSNQYPDRDNSEEAWLYGKTPSGVVREWLLVEH